MAMNWGIGPDQRDLGQPIMEYLYATATKPGPSDGSPSDFYVATEPIGYTYPTRFADSDRLKNAPNMNVFMGDMDLNVLNMVVYKESFDRVGHIFDHYLQTSGFKCGINYQPSAIHSSFYWYSICRCLLMPYVHRMVSLQSNYVLY
jgi:hypothetical protein